MSAAAQMEREAYAVHLSLCGESVTFRGKSWTWVISDPADALPEDSDLFNICAAVLYIPITDLSGLNDYPIRDERVIREESGENCRILSVTRAWLDYVCPLEILKTNS
jgi:hypothetical protein